MYHHRVAGLPLMGLVIGMEHQDRRCPLKLPENPIQYHYLSVSWRLVCPE
jgi:hypothetical protein